MPWGTNYLEQTTSEVAFPDWEQTTLEVALRGTKYPRGRPISGIISNVSARIIIRSWLVRIPGISDQERSLHASPYAENYLHAIRIKDDFCSCMRYKRPRCRCGHHDSFGVLPELQQHQRNTVRSAPQPKYRCSINGSEPGDRSAQAVQHMAVQRNLKVR